MLSNYQIVLTATVGGRIRVGLAEEAIFKYSQGKALSTHTPDLLKADIIMFIAYPHRSEWVYDCYKLTNLARGEPIWLFRVLI